MHYIREYNIKLAKGGKKKKKKNRANKPEMKAEEDKRIDSPLLKALLPITGTTISDFQILFLIYT